MEEEYREDTTSIEITFPVPVNLSGRRQQQLVALIEAICDEYEEHHPDRTMWAAGVGAKMLTNPFLVDDEHPMEFDTSVFNVECFERENYDYAPIAQPTGEES